MLLMQYIVNYIRVSDDCLGVLKIKNSANKGVNN